MIDTGHGVRSRKEHQIRDAFSHVSWNRLNHTDSLYFCTKKLDTIVVFFARWEDLKRITENSKHALFKIRCAPIKLKWNKMINEILEDIFLSDGQPQNTTKIFFLISNTIDTAHRSDDDDIFSGEKCLCRSMTETIDFIIDGRVLFDICIGFLDICFWLIVIVIADKIVDSILWEKFSKFLTKLSSESFIVSNYESGALDFLNNICHCEGLSRPSNTLKCLITIACFEAFYQGVYGLRLVSSWFIITFEIKEHL